MSDKHAPAPLPPKHGLINLSYKATPSDSVRPNERSDIVCISLLNDSLLHILAPLQARVKALPESAWTRAGQADNVTIMRPYHDKLGIFNIPFIFCDDAVRNVYHFPWLEQWWAEIEPVLKYLKIDLSRLLRCVMARLPPGVTIPVHHDTGRWVQVAHRVHIPLLTSGKVFFYAGHSNTELERYHVPFGNAFELNNAAKHKVENYGTTFRVHFMLDFVDNPPHLLLTPFPPTIKLQASDSFVQTRRTLQLARLAMPLKQRENNELPLCIIIGAMKAGTTSLFDYLTQHPKVVGAVVKETHIFDWNWHKKFPSPGPRGSTRFKAIKFFCKNVKDLNQLQICNKKSEELKKNEKKPEGLDFQMQSKMQNVASLFDCEKLMRDRESICVEVKIIMIIRDPIMRCYSHYCMMVDKVRPVKRHASREAMKGLTFAEAVDKDLLELQNCGITGEDVDADCRLFASRYLPTRPHGHGGHSLIGRGLYLAQLLPWMQMLRNSHSKSTPLSSCLKVISLCDLKTNLNATMDNIFQFVGIHNDFVVADASVKNKRHYPNFADAVDATCVKKLKKIFTLHNKALVQQFPYLAGTVSSWI